jgi:chaperone required for assembly of F1-ATPase
MAESGDERAARSAMAARKGANAELPRRFYKTAEVREQSTGFAVVLDNKPVRTPGRKPLTVPARSIAEAMAAEWASQAEAINPATMPMTRLVNSAIDGVVGAEASVAADIAKYAASDLICYRADFPESLVALQTLHWDPVLAWARESHGWRFAQSVGVVHVAQPPDTLRSIGEAIASHDAYALAGLHSMTTLMGSVLLALAVAGGRLSAAEAWTAAHVDEDWQISQWGEDADARVRREYRWREMQAAALLIGLPG